jgi:hypothetical protein
MVLTILCLSWSCRDTDSGNYEKKIVLICEWHSKHGRQFCAFFLGGKKLGTARRFNPKFKLYLILLAVCLHDRMGAILSRQPLNSKILSYLASPLNGANAKP